MYCINCGKQIPTMSRFCRHCGASQQDTVVGMVPTGQAPQPQPPQSRQANSRALLLIIGVLVVVISISVLIIQPWTSTGPSQLVLTLPPPTQVAASDVQPTSAQANQNPQPTTGQPKQNLQSLSAEAISLQPYNFTSKDDGDGWKLGYVVLAYVNNTGNLLQPGEIPVTDLNLRTTEGQDYEAKLLLVSNRGDLLDYNDPTNLNMDKSEPSTSLRVGYVYKSTNALSLGKIELTPDNPLIPPGIPITMVSLRGAQSFTDEKTYQHDGVGYFNVATFRFAQSAHPSRLAITYGGRTVDLDLSGVVGNTPVTFDPGMNPNLGNLEVDVSNINPQLRASFGPCNSPPTGQRGLTYSLGYNVSNLDTLNQQEIKRAYGIWYSNGVFVTQFLFEPFLTVGPGQNPSGKAAILDPGAAPKFLVLYDEPRQAAQFYGLSCGSLSSTDVKPMPTAMQQAQPIATSTAENTPYITEPTPSYSLFGVGSFVRVVDVPLTFPLPIRSAPGTSNPKIASAALDEHLLIIGGPSADPDGNQVCHSEWWRVRWQEQGWANDGGNDGYLLPRGSGSEITAGKSVIVSVTPIPGDDYLSLRDQPRGGDGNTLGWLQPGHTYTVIDGPIPAILEPYIPADSRWWKLDVQEEGWSCQDSLQLLSTP